MSVIGSVLLTWIVFFLVLDVVAYSYAKYPDRCKWWSVLPGSGFLAILLFGRGER